MVHVSLPQKLKPRKYSKHPVPEYVSDDYFCCLLAFNNIQATKSPFIFNTLTAIKHPQLESKI